MGGEGAGWDAGDAMQPPPDHTQQKITKKLGTGNPENYMATQKTININGYVIRPLQTEIYEKNKMELQCRRHHKNKMLGTQNRIQKQKSRKL